MSVQETHQIEQSNKIRARNYLDDSGNPAGGYCSGPGLCIHWQDGPRGRDNQGVPAPSNGAFVEDAIVAAIQRLQFFQASPYSHHANRLAIQHLHAALSVLGNRSAERASRGVLGQNIV